MARYSRQSSTFQPKKAAPQFSEKPVSQSVNWEQRLLDKIRAAGLPEPVREYLFARSIKRQWRADFAYIQERILFEVEGGLYTRGRHVRGKGYEEDCKKYNWATLLGYQVLRFSPGMISSGLAIDMIKVALGQDVNASVYKK